METLIQDLRFAVRTLAKSPGFFAVAVLCIALGIGTNTTIFSVVNAALLRPYPAADPERIVVLHGTQLRNEIDEGGVSYLDYQEYKAQSTLFSQMAAFTNRSITVTGDDEPERLMGASISHDLFPLLGERPALGRTFLPEEDRPGAPPVVLLGHDVWMRRFNGDPAILNKSIIVNATPHTVVGVMPPRFKFPYQQEAWLPLAPFVKDYPRTDRVLGVYARLKPGATAAQAEAEMQGIAKRLESTYPDANKGWSARVMTLREETSGEEMRLIILTAMGAVGFVLLIACANVANLLLARATQRQREIAIRIAFGATRGRIVRQLLTESVLIALAGAALGIALAVWGIRWIELSIPPENATPYWMRFTLDGPVLLFTLAAAVVTGLLFGLAPALQAVKTDLNDTLKEGGRGAGGSVVRNRLRSALVIAEVALSLVLLVGASLFVRSFLNIQDADVGFDTRNLLTMRIYLPGDPYEEDEPKARRVEDVVRRLETIPGVEAVGASNNVPLGGGGGGGAVLFEGRPVTPGEEPLIYWAGVTPHFFRALGVPVKRGRDFNDEEGSKRSGVALVNETFVKKFFPDTEAIGRRFRIKEEEKMDWVTIVGIVPDVANDNIDDEGIEASAYLSYPYQTARNTGLTIRTRRPVAEVIAAARAEIKASDANLPVFEVYTMDQVRRLGNWEFRFFGGMFTVFGLIALFLAAIGVYGVLSYSVSQRLREIGVRIALGARRRDVLRLVLGQGVGLALIGIGIGLLGAFGVTRVISSILYGISATDLVSFGLNSLLLAAVAALASYVPADRAMRVDPLEALRDE
ncbi:MAG TPA: ABC transporter permease [Thermoanaerobaculia bacterium]